MASILLDVENIYPWHTKNGVTEVAYSSEILHGFVDGLNVTFDETKAADLDRWIEFTGPREHLVEVINRYEDDEGLRPDLVDEIVGD